MLESHASLLRLCLPDIILENFELKGVIQESETFHFQLEERNDTPEEWGAIKVESKGFPCYTLTIILPSFFPSNKSIKA